MDSSLLNQLVNRLHSKYSYIYPNKQQLKNIVNLILESQTYSESEKEDLLQSPWKLIYRCKPPDPTEFLAKWLGKGSRVYDHVRDTFLETFNPEKSYFEIYLSPHIGWGKSLYIALCSLYVITHLCLMIDPKAYYDVDKSSAFGIYLGSFTNEKAKQILFTYLKNLMKNNDKFIFCRFKDKMEALQKKNPECIIWSGPKDGYDLSFHDDVFVVIASDYNDLVGLNLVFCAVTEISFFLKHGADPEYIEDFAEGLKGRVHSRFGNNTPLAKIAFDTSPYSMSSPIDRRVFSGEAEKGPKNLVIRGSFWDTYPERFPEFDVDYFWFYHGSPEDSPRLIEEDEKIKFDKDAYSRCPGTLRELAEKDAVKFLRDYVGRPSWDTPLIFSKTLIDSCVSFNLPYIPTFLSSVESSKIALIDQFDQLLVGSLFGIEKKHVYYSHMDLSQLMDTTGLSIGHKATIGHQEGLPEYLIGQEMYIVDVVVPIAAFGSPIPYEQIYEFYRVLRERMNLNYVSLDSYGGPYMAERLISLGFDVKQNYSVDKTPDKYWLMSSLMRERRVAFGPNPVLLGNFSSLIYRTNTRGIKVDHYTGKLGITPSQAGLPIIFNNIEQVRELSYLGNNAKDCSDSVCGLVSLMAQTKSDMAPREEWFWDDEKNKNNDFDLELILRDEKYIL